jgi:predicted RecA/RadA family phage recombinase
MKNFAQPGCVMTVPSLAAAIDSGMPLLVGAVPVVATGTYAIGDNGEFATEGVFEFAKTTGAAMAQGALVEWDIATAKVIADAGGDYDLGHVWEAASSGATTVKVKLLAK